MSRSIGRFALASFLLVGSAFAQPAPTISANFGGKVSAAIRQNLHFSQASKVAGNPGAEFDITLLPDGTIRSLVLSQSSGIPEWDAAAQEAIRKTVRLPPDDSGYMPPRLFVTLRPKE